MGRDHGGMGAVGFEPEGRGGCQFDMTNQAEQGGAKQVRREKS